MRGRLGLGKSSPLHRHKLPQSLAQHNRRTSLMRALANALSLPCQSLDAAVKSQPRRISRATVLIISIAGLVLAAVLWGWWSYSRPAVPLAATTQVPSEDGVRLEALQISSLGIKAEPAVSTDEVALTGLPAEAMPPLEASTQVTVPYAGIVIRLLVDEGERVRRGQPLLRLQSRELLAAQADVQRARSQAALAGQQARRDAQLAEEGIIPAARREQSSASAAIAQASRLQAEGMLSQLRVVSGGSPGEYEVLAPQDGRILRRSAAPGQAMEAMAPVFVIADATRMDVMFSAPVDLREQLLPGLEVALPGGGRAQIVSVSGDTDRSSQSLRVRARADAAGSLLAGQQFAVVLKLPAPAGALRVPRSALLPHRDQQLLYVQQGDLFHGVVVNQLGHDDTHAVVLSPSLQPGMQVVSRGASVLKSMAPVE